MTDSNVTPIRISERRQSRLDQAIRDLHHKHALMATLLETASTCAAIADECREREARVVDAVLARETRGGGGE